MAVFSTGKTSRVDAVHIMAGCMLILGVILTHWMSQWFLIMIAFVGVNMFQYGWSGLCPAETVFTKLGFPEPSSCSGAGYSNPTKVVVNDPTETA